MTAKKQQTLRGRPPLGDRAMTTAEAKRRSRDLARASGARTFQITVRGALREQLEEIALVLGVTPARAFMMCAECGLDPMRRTALNIRDQLQRESSGVTLSSIDALEQTLKDGDPLKELDEISKGGE